MFYQILLFVILQSIARSEDCNVEGTLCTYQTWHGFIGSHLMSRNDSRMEYTFKYLLSSTPVNVLLYFDDQIKELENLTTCSDKEAVMRRENNQIINLTTSNYWSGCKAETDDDNGPIEKIICRGRRSFRSIKPRTWSIAVSSCNSSCGIHLEYNLTFINHLDETCNGKSIVGSIRVDLVLFLLYCLYKIFII